MRVAGKRRFPDLVQTVIDNEDGTGKSTEVTINSDASAILEALLAELDEATVLAALDHQGLAGASYLSTLRTLAEVARMRRPLRLAGT